jgi:Zn-dependent metalloprotease
MRFLNKQIVFLIIAIAVTANSQVPILHKPNESEGVIFNPTGEIEEEFGTGNVTGIKYAENGTVRFIGGKLDMGITATDRLDKCYEFFELHKDLFGLDNPKEELVLLDVSRDSLIYKFRQYHDGIPISSPRVRVTYSLRNTYSISGAGGHFYPEIKNLSSTPAISEEEAIRIARDDYLAQKHGAEAKLGKTRQLIYLNDVDDSYYLAWRIVIGAWWYHIDAMSGSIKRSFLNLK